VESSLFNPRYMGLADEAALARLARLSETCRTFGGDFSCLWHNGQTSDPARREFFTDALQIACGGGV